MDTQLPHYEDLLKDISREIGMNPEIIKRKASIILKKILHNYAGFDVVTIDTFTHRILRTFARDLGIPLNFEVEMDVENLLHEAVDSVIAKVGYHPELSKVIINFALAKLEEDKSWDITLELNKAAKLLLSENDQPHLKKLLSKTLTDFKKLKKVVKAEVVRIKSKVVSDATSILEKIDKNKIADRDFIRGYIPAHFKKLAAGNTVDYKAGWKQNIKETSFYSAKTADQIKDRIDGLRPVIEEVFLRTQMLFNKIRFLENILKNLTPLSVLNAINQELQRLKKEKRVLLISEFNKIISSAVKDQPAPFIYERLGEKYRDYFIDEFQDTSGLQWENLIPLIGNALATETSNGKRGHLSIVGDAKQAIYRWRGGEAEQFIALSNEYNPFPVQKQVVELPKNYRSCKEIIKFNNNFFTYMAKSLGNPVYKELYASGNRQEYNFREGGFIDVSFIEARNVEEENKIYPMKVHTTIQELVEFGYLYSDICILTRRRKEGAVIADYLSREGVPIVSSETLLLQNDPKVRFLIDVLTWHTHQSDLQAKSRMLHFIAEHFSVSNTHLFLKNMMDFNKKDLVTGLSSLGVIFDFKSLTNKPFYEAVEYCVHAFDLGNDSPAYIQFFLDVVFTYTQQHADGVTGFLTYWEEKKDKLSIVAPDGENAVRMMTIHKSKGLEFECVIYPYANTDIYAEIDPKIWMPVESGNFLDFDEVWLDYNKNLEVLGKIPKILVEERQSQLELDAVNMMYVAFTRAKKNLYILSRLELNSKGVYNERKFSGKLIGYLQHAGKWNDGATSFTMGILEPKPEKISSSQSNYDTFTINSFISKHQHYKVNIVTNASKLWDTKRGNAIEKGNLMHGLMAMVHTAEDIGKTVDKAYEAGQIMASEKEEIYNGLYNVVSHPNLAAYYKDTCEIITERDIFSHGSVYRPDRVIFVEKGEVVIIDYKTGDHHILHTRQLEEYGYVLEKMGYQIREKIVIYFGQELYLKYV